MSKDFRSSEDGVVLVNEAFLSGKIVEPEAIALREIIRRELPSREGVNWNTRGFSDDDTVAGEQADELSQKGGGETSVFH